jgi:hypothetical protein
MFQVSRRRGRVLIIIFFLLIAAVYMLGKPERARQAELAACQQAVAAELELLAANALEGYTIVIEQGTVSILLASGEVLATGEFLAGTKFCQDIIGEQ